jgi:hypothetical protein
MDELSEHGPHRLIVVCERCFRAGSTYNGAPSIVWRTLKRWSGTHEAREARLRRRLPDNIAAICLCPRCSDEVRKVEGRWAAAASIAILWNPAGWAYASISTWSVDADLWPRLVALVGYVLGYLVALFSIGALIFRLLIRPINDAVRGRNIANRLYLHMSLVGESDWPVSAQRQLEAEEHARAVVDAEVAERARASGQGMKGRGLRDS